VLGNFGGRDSDRRGSDRDSGARRVEQLTTDDIRRTVVVPVLHRRASDLHNAAASYRARLIAQSGGPRQSGMSGGQSGMGSAPPSNRHRVLVVGFFNASVGRFASTLSPLRFTIADMISTELASDSTLESVYESSNINGAESAIVGSYVGDASGRLRISALLVDVGTRKMLRTETMEGSQDTALVVIRSIAHQLLCDLRTHIGRHAQRRS
jgi:hypothetical protein